MRTIRQLAVIVKYRLIAARNALRTLHTQSRLKLATILGLSLFLWVGLFRFAWEAFLWVEDQNEIVADLVTSFIFDIFFFSLGGMLLASNILMGYGALFGAEETRLLSTSPVNRRSVFLFKGLETLSFSSWSVVALGVPLFAAYGLTHTPPVSPVFYPVAVAAMGIYIVLIAAAGQTLNLLFAALFPRRRKEVLIVLLGVVVAALVAYSLWHLADYRTDKPMQRWMGDLPARFGFLRHFLLPSHWMSLIFLGAAQPGAGEFAFPGGMLLSTTLALCMAYLVSGVLLYERACDRVRSAGGAKLVHSGMWQRILSRLMGRGHGAMLAKDILYFLRDPSQWLQFAVLLGLLLFYFLNLRAIGYHARQEMWKAIIGSLNLFSVVMVLSTLSTRFFFPLISLEGRRFWILGLAPVSRGRLLYSKFLFAFLCNVLLAEGMILVSNLMLGSALSFGVYQFCVALCAAAALAGLAVGLGAVFPDYAAASPAQAVSGFGGTLCMILSLGYSMVVVIASAFAPVSLSRSGPHSVKAVIIGTAIVLVSTVLATWWPLRAGEAVLREAEL